MSAPLPLEDIKNVYSKSIENRHLTAKKRRDGNGYYPYCHLPGLEGRTDLVELFVEGLARMYLDFFDGSENPPTTAIYPEAKSWLLASDFKRYTGIPGVVSRKRNNNVPGQIVVRVKTPHGGEFNMYIPELDPVKDKRPIIVDDIISEGETGYGHLKALENMGYDTVGLITPFERGDGLNNLRKEFPDKFIAGVARIGISPREELKYDLTHSLGNPEEHELLEAAMDFLYFRDSQWSPYTKDSWLNRYFQSRVERFFDEV